MNKRWKKGNGGGVTVENASNSEIISKDLIERGCVQPRPEKKEKMRVRTRKE